jgi:hypothetical protein
MQLGEIDVVSELQYLTPFEASIVHPRRSPCFEIVAEAWRERCEFAHVRLPWWCPRGHSSFLSLFRGYAGSQVSSKGCKCLREADLRKDRGDCQTVFVVDPSSLVVLLGHPRPNPRGRRRTPMNGNRAPIGIASWPGASEPKLSAPSRESGFFFRPKRPGGSTAQNRRAPEKNRSGRRETPSLSVA